MQANPFQKATKKRAKLRMALMGTSGAGKTYTALSVASALGRIAVIDTERGSASKYAGLFEFDVLELTNFHPQQYIDAIKAAADAGYDVVVIDSLSHAWSGTGGALEIVDRVTKQSQSKNSYMAWADVTPLQNKLIDAMIGAPMHVIATMRSKTEYVIERDERGKSTPRKVGLAPVQRDGMEYEFDVVGEMDMSNTLVITKTRVPALANAVIPTPGAALAETLVEWLQDGVEAPTSPTQPRADEQPPQRQSNAPTPAGGAGNAVPNAAGAPSQNTPSTSVAGASGDDFDKKFPPRQAVTGGTLWEAMHDFFDNERHFKEHWNKHTADYAGKTLEEASAWLRNYHWNYDKEACKRLVADAKANYGMDIDNVMEALSNAAGHAVKRMVQWDGGDWGAARAAVTLWAEQHAEAVGGK